MSALGKSSFLSFGPVRYVDEHIDNGDIKLVYVPVYVGTEDQIADYFTKVILAKGGVTHASCCNQLIR